MLIQFFLGYIEAVKKNMEAGAAVGVIRWSRIWGLHHLQGFLFFQLKINYFKLRWEADMDTILS